MSMTNVNNLNGVPNFGHGFPEEQIIETETQIETREETPEETKGEEVEALPEEIIED